jgi:pimeloyl-ACP methyl ester carboxylesterase
LQDRSVSGQTTVDVDVAVRWLVEQGARRVIVVGTCWGGLVALVAAARHEVVAGAVLVSPPLRLIETGASATQLGRRPERLGRAASRLMSWHVVRMLVADRQYRRWVISRVAGRVARVRARFTGTDLGRQAGDFVEVSGRNLFAPLLRRRVPVRVLFGEQDPTYLGLRAAGALPSLEAASEIIHMEVTPVTVHGLNTIQAQEAALRFVRECLAREAGAAAPAA